MAIVLEELKDGAPEFSSFRLSEAAQFLYDEGFGTLKRYYDDDKGAWFIEWKYSFKRGENKRIERTFE